MRMRKRPRWCEDQAGFLVLIELLIVVAILGVLAAVIIPNLGNMIGVADVSAANTEADIVRTAALAYHTDAGGWPDDTFTGAGGVLNPYIDKTIKGSYELSSGIITDATWVDSSITFNSDNGIWERP